MKKFFILNFFISIFFMGDIKLTFAQSKLNESFEGATFPPPGWSINSIPTGEGLWGSSIRSPKSGNKCAVTNFTSGISSNYLITKRFIPSAGDSLVFSFKQTFWNNYKDTFNVFISTTDSLPQSLTTRLLHFMDSVSYPSPLYYARFAVSLNAYAGQNVWIGFQHINLDGDNIRLDDISVGKSLANEVGIVENSFPSGSIGACYFESMIPKARIKNFGTLNQNVPFNITYSISGPASYTSSRSDTISSGYDKLIFFDTLNLSQTGVYNVKIYTSLPGDENRSNDTLYSTFTILNTNFGGGLPLNGGYYFSNSSSCSSIAPSSPQFCWKDTSRSNNLILNKNDVSNGLLTGDIDNGYFSLGNILPAGSKIKFFNYEYDSVFITTNGVIGFKKNNALLSSDPTQLTYLLSQPIPAISVFWIDMDFGNTFSQENRLSYKVAGNQLIITYDRAPLKSGGASDYVSFQVYFELGNSLLQNSKILVQYNMESTGAGFLSGYYSNSLPPNLIGMKNTYSNNYLIYRQQDTSGVLVKGPLFNSSLALEFGPNQNTLNNKPAVLDLTVLLEAISPRQDTVTVSIRDSKNQYSILETKKIFLDTMNKLSCIFTIPDNQYKYYISINQKNSIETWSKDSGEVFNSYTLNYDFSIDPEMAYGGNMLFKDGRSYIYTGDVNQDGIVNSNDITYIFNDLSSFTTNIDLSDLNKDGSLTLHDLLYCVNNNMKFVRAISP